MIAASVFVASVALTAGAAVVVGQQSASAFSTGYGGAKVSCVTLVLDAPSGPAIRTKCGSFHHEVGPRQR